MQILLNCIGLPDVSHILLSRRNTSDQSEQNEGQADESGQYSESRGSSNASSSLQNTEVVVSSLSGETSPYAAFDIEECQTFGHLWEWDIFLSCTDDDLGEDCSCTFAEVLLEKGTLSCEDALRCPADCRICTTCLHLVGCSNVSASGSVTAGSNGASVLASLGYFTVFLSAAACMLYKSIKKKSGHANLKTHLVDSEHVLRPGQKIWMVPVDPLGSANNHGTSWQVTKSVSGTHIRSLGSTNSGRSSVFDESQEIEWNLKTQSSDKDVNKRMKGLFIKMGSIKVEKSKLFSSAKSAKPDKNSDIRGTKKEQSMHTLSNEHDRFSSSLFPDLLPPSGASVNEDEKEENQTARQIQVNSKTPTHLSSQPQPRPEHGVWLICTDLDASIISGLREETDEDVDTSNSSNQDDFSVSELLEDSVGDAVAANQESLRGKVKQ